MNIDCYAAQGAKAPLETFSYVSPTLAPWDVEVKISHCGICHSDVHLVDNDWGISQYPLVPGHEIVGTVSAMGASVKHLKAGQRVGIGWQSSSCMTCEWCISGKEKLCSQMMGTCLGRHGGFAKAVVVDSRFAFVLPDKLESENAAPLLCGGITVFAPLIHFDIRPTMKVGVIGVGGLGHLALQFYKAWGCEVTAFSSTSGKEKEAKDFGAHRVLNSKDAEALKANTATQDFIISTAPGDLDWAAYLDVLRPEGKLCVVGVPQNPMAIPAFPLIAGQKTVCGSPIGGRSDIETMLAFAARHGIEAKTESFAMSEVNPAMDRVRNNQARYRVVLKN
ncbi:MAG: NAD(P)-dependent alcohol dehydrogenase [Nitrospinaceae bacterium]